MNNTIFFTNKPQNVKQPTVRVPVITAPPNPDFKPKGKLGADGQMDASMLQIVAAGSPTINISTPKKYKFIAPFSTMVRVKGKQGMEEKKYAIGDVIIGELVTKKFKDGQPDNNEIRIRVAPASDVAPPNRTPYMPQALPELLRDSQWSNYKLPDNFGGLPAKPPSTYSDEYIYVPASLLQEDTTSFINTKNVLFAATILAVAYATLKFAKII